MLDSLKSFDPAANIDLNGAKLAIVSWVFDIVFLAFHYFFKKWYDAKNYREYRELKAELETIDPRKEFGRYSKLNRKKARVKRTLPEKYRVPFLVKMTRTTFFSLFFMRKVVCEFSGKFWWPFTRMAAFPHSYSEEVIPVGFSFYWITVTRTDNAIYKFITGEDL